MMNELLWVTQAEYANEYKLSLTFSNNVTKLVDLKGSLYGEVFEPLKNIENFKQFKLFLVVILLIHKDIRAQNPLRCTIQPSSLLIQTE